MSIGISDKVVLGDVLKYVGIKCPKELMNTKLNDIVSSMDMLEYKLYAWDYGDGTVVGYTEKEVPVAGDIILLKADMGEGEITSPSDLKLVYHVVSDADGVITVSEHPEGQTGGYTFKRDTTKDYAETITGVTGVADVAANGLVMLEKGRLLKGINVNVGA